MRLIYILCTLPIVAVLAVIVARTSWRRRRRPSVLPV